MLLHLAALIGGLLLAMTVLRHDPQAAHRLCRTGAWVFGGTTLAAIPALLYSPWTTSWVPYAPSLLHVLLLAALALSFALAGWPRGPLRRLPLITRLVMLLAAAAVLCLAISPVRQALLGGLAYVRGNVFSPLAIETRGLANAPQRLVKLIGWPLLLGAVAETKLVLSSAIRRRATSDSPQALGSGAHVVWLWLPRRAVAVLAPLATPDPAGLHRRPLT